MHVLLLHNPWSREGSTPSREVLATALAEHGASVETLAVDGDRTRAALRQALETGFDAVVSAGGDGTAHLAANVLAGTSTPLLVLPCGTANDFARSLGLPRDWPTALALGLQGGTTTVDLGRLNGEYFLNAVSAGMGAQAAHHSAGKLKRRWRRLAYPLAVLKMALRHRSWSFVLECDRAHLSVEAYQVLVANGPRFGGGFQVSREATLDEGLLDVVVIERGWRHLLDGLLRPGTPWIECLGSRKLRVDRLRLDGPACSVVAVDGELMICQPPLDIELVPRALRVCAARVGGFDNGLAVSP